MWNPYVVPDPEIEQTPQGVEWSRNGLRRRKPVIRGKTLSW